MAFIDGPQVISVFTRLKLPARYATDNGIEKVVTVKAGEPGPKQIWFVQPVKGKENVYTITVGPTPPKLETPGFRREIERGPDDVLNSPFPGEWLLVPVEEGPFVFEVHPVDKIVGVEQLLATDDIDKVVIKTFPIVPEPIRIEKPAWRFTPILKD